MSCSSLTPCLPPAPHPRRPSCPVVVVERVAHAGVGIRSDHGGVLCLARAGITLLGHEYGLRGLERAHVILRFRYVLRTMALH